MIRKKIREIDSGYHCSIIGTCLTLEEVRQLLEVSCNKDFSKCTDYILHGMAVSAAGGLSKLSNKITDKLNSKYRIDIHKTAELNDHLALERFWEKSNEEGNIAGPYWAVLSHPYCTDELRNRVFGEVHMLSHLAGANERKTRIEISGYENEIKKLGLSRNALRNKILISGEENKNLRKENKALKKEIEKLRNLHKDFERSGEKLHGKREGDLEAETVRLRSKLEFSENRADTLLERINFLTEELESYREYTELLGRLSDDAEEQTASPCAMDCRTEYKVDLRGKRVLLVGGRLSMIPHCRSVVEFMNGRFVYHDGGKEQSRTALQGLAAGADIVICALDCVSHDASRCVKRICRDSGQKIIMLKRSGLSTFARELKRAV